MTLGSVGNGHEQSRNVSVAIATHNGAGYLPDLLDSILSQTVPPKEIVCADDASTDDTVQILEQYAQNSSVPIRIIQHQRNIGVIENFLSAFRETTGSLIAYCDQDDVWLERKLEACVGAFDEDVSLVCHASIIVDGDLNESGEVYYDIKEDQRLQFPAISCNQHCWGHQIVFDRATLTVLLELYEDDTFRQSDFGTCFDYGIPFAASLTGSLHVMREPLVKFRRHDDALTTAGKEHASEKGLFGRLAKRTKNVGWLNERLIDVAAIMASCKVNGAVAFDESKRTYDDYRELVSRRRELINASGLFKRLRQFPRVALAYTENRRRHMRSPIKELVIDFLMAFIAGPKQQRGLS